MGIIGFFKKIGGFFKHVFSGMVGIFIQDFEDITEEIVRLLVLADIPGSAKFKTALAVLEGYALKAGKSFIVHAARLLIEMTVANINGEDLKKIADEGLSYALEAVDEVNVMDLFDDDERRDKAFNILWNKLIDVGKNELATTNIIHVLIELAVAQRKKEAAL